MWNLQVRNEKVCLIFSYLRFWCEQTGHRTLSLHLWITCFFSLPGCMTQPCIGNSPRKPPFPHFPGCPLRYSSLAPSHAELFLRSREGAGFPEKKEMWSAELSEEKIIKRKKPRLQRNRSFFLYNLFKFSARNIFFSSSKESPAFSSTEIYSVREGCQGY